MRFRVGLILSLALFGCAAGDKPLVANTSSGDDVMIVTADVADVRTKPFPHDGRYVMDPNQETQVLKGERVIVHERQRGWVRVECPQQPEFTHHGRWEGYPGWIESSALTSDLSAEIPVVRSTATGNDLRQQILDEARRHLGEAYLWGGRSLHDSHYVQTVTGVDCSGLVNWSFRQVGIIVPRDAREQFMKARPLAANQLREADLIFVASAERPDKVVHVGFYSGQGRILEAPQSGDVVHEIPIEQRFGVPLTDLRSGQRVGNSVIYFGTLLDQ